MKNSQQMKITGKEVNLNNITFTYDKGHTVLQLVIKDDITALESTNINILLFHCASIAISKESFIDFIKEKGIERHFKNLTK